MEYQAARVADIGQMRPEVHPLHGSDARLEPTLEPDREPGAGPAWPVPRRQVMPRTGRQAGVGHPGNGLVAVEELGNGLCVGNVAIHPQRQRLDAGQDEEGVGWREGRSEVAQGDRPGLHREPEVAERLDEIEAVIAGIRPGEEWELP